MNKENHISSYLRRLQFDPSLMRGFVAKYLSNPRLVLLLVFLIVLVGVNAYMNLPRRLNPEIKIPIVNVITVLPGAGPNDVEQLITIPIEDAVTGVEKVKTVTSSSRDSVSAVTIEFESGIDADKAKSDVQGAVDGVTDLPADAQTPRVAKLDFENQPVWQFVLSGNTDEGSLMQFAKKLRDDIEQLPSVDRAEIAGLTEQEVQILLKPEVISTYNINPLQLTQAIKVATKSLPAGTVRTQNSTFTLTIDPDVVSVGDLRNLRVNLNNQILLLGQIAELSQKAKPDQAQSYIIFPNEVSQKRSVTFNVFRASTVNIDKAINDSKKVIDDNLGQYHNQFNISSILNAQEEIDKQYNELSRDFLLTVGLVLLILFVFLGLRQAVIAALAMPLTFFITFTVMSISGITLSFIALFSLLLSLGLLVDDTIVVVSAMTDYYRSGKFSPLQTGLLVWRDFFVPILTTTITTVWAFLPLLLSTGIIGEFIKPIPIVVSTSLLGSFFVAMLITLPLTILFLKPMFPKRVTIFIRLILLIGIVGVFYLIVPKSQIVLLTVLAFLIFLFVFFQVKDSLFESLRKLFRVKPSPKKGETSRISRYIEDGIFHFGALSGAYKGVILRILASRGNRIKTVALVIIFSIFAYVLVPIGFVQNEFFPKTDENFLYVSLELPPGTNLDTTRVEGEKVFLQLKDTPFMEFITMDLAQAFDASFGSVGASGSNTVLYTIKLIDHKERNSESSKIAEGIRTEFASYSAGRLAVQEVSGGPPAGADLQIKLYGDDLNQLNKYASQIQDYLKTQSGVTNIDKSIKPGTSKLVFVPDKDKLASFNLTPDAVGGSLRLFASGFQADEVKFEGQGKEKTDITFRMSGKAQFVEDVSSIIIPSPSGAISLASLGNLKLEPNPTLITREDGKRTLSVSAGVTKGFNVATLNTSLEKYANSINLPPGYSWKTGGVNEENNRSVTSILQAMLLSFLLIITTIVVQFSSFRRALIVMLVIPLSIAGVFIIFALTKTPLSFPALIGVLALFGIVVKNSILVVDKIVQNLKTDMSFSEAVADGSASRLEAITLTSVATIAGLLPITLSDPLWRGLGGAIIAGLTFSGTIMLFFIPVVYYILFRSEEEKKVPAVKRKERPVTR